MSHWRCYHRRTSPLAGTGYAEIAHWPSFALEAAQTSLPVPHWAIAVELQERRLKCPACRAQDRRVRRAWALVAAAALLVLLIGWRCRG